MLVSYCFAAAVVGRGEFSSTGLGFCHVYYYTKMDKGMVILMAQESKIVKEGCKARAGNGGKVISL